MFRISRYALAHSFAHKHRFHRSRSPLVVFICTKKWLFLCIDHFTSKLSILPVRHQGLLLLIDGLMHF